MDRAKPADVPATATAAPAPPRIIDIHNHVMPAAYLDLVRTRYKDPGMVKRLTSIRMLWDIEARVEMLGQWPGLRQVISLASPPPEALGGPDESPEAARICNNGLAEICARWPDKFPTFVAALPMNNVPAALIEMDRAIGELGACGIMIMTNVGGRPLDDPEFLPVFEHATNRHGVPIWMHPLRPAGFTDYVAEPKSRYEIWQVMGWPYETTASMARIVFSGMFDRVPGMRILTHHCGGMLPFFNGRAETLWLQLGSRTSDEDYSQVLSGLERPFMDYFRAFHGDTVLGGSTAALRCGLDFFGADHVVFASDCPFDPEGGEMYIREGLRSVEELGLDGDAREKILLRNAERLLTRMPRL